MEKRYFFTLFIIVLINTLATAQNTYVPDNNFEQALINKGYDTVLDDSVCTATIQSITELDISNNNISDLTGIEDFTALEEFSCSYNQLTSLDLSNNTALEELSCPNNQLTSLDLSSNTSLEYLSCYYNQLSSLDLSNNTALKKLFCFGNQLTGLDLSSNNALERLDCYDNQLSSLNLNNNAYLERLYCYDNQLSSLDLSNNTALKRLSCFGNQLANLDLSNNTALDGLSCSDNQLTSLDLSNSTALKQLYCSDNQLSSLELSNNTALRTVYCYGNQLSSLNLKNSNNDRLYRMDATRNPYLYCIEVDDSAAANTDSNWKKDGIATYNEDCNGFVLPNFSMTYVPDDNFEQALIDCGYDTVLDDSVCTATVQTATYLDISYSGVTDFTSFEDFVSLQEFYCSGNQMTSLDLSDKINLITLDCSDNQLTVLDVNNNINLEDLSCNNNQLISLDISSNTSLCYLYCSDNQLTDLNLKNGNNDNLYYMDATGNSDLTCIEVDDPDAIEKYHYWEKDEGASYSINCNSASEIIAIPITTDTEDNDMIKVFPNPVSNELNINSNAEIKTVKVFSTTGAIVIWEEIATTEFTLNTQKLSPGVYGVNILTDKGAFVKTIIKK